MKNLKTITGVAVAVALALASIAYAVNITVPSAPGTGYYLVSTSTGAYVYVASSATPFYFKSNPSNFITAVSSSALFVPYTGATGNVNLGANQLTADTLIGTGGLQSWNGNGFDFYSDAGLTQAGSVSADASGVYTFGNPSGAAGKLDFSGLNTSDQTFILPNLSGTFAVSTTAPLTFSGGVVGCPTATGSASGCLSSTDWTTFNNKFTLPSLTAGSVIFSDGSTLTQDNLNFFFNNSTNRVGIGTSTPENTLSVVETGANSFGTFRIHGLSSVADGYGQIDITDTASMAEGVGGLLQFSGRTATAGTFNSLAAIKAGKANGTSANTEGYLSFYTRSGVGTYTEKLRIASSGFVGVGTTTPRTTLHVNGSTTIEKQLILPGYGSVGYLTLSAGGLVSTSSVSQSPFTSSTITIGATTMDSGTYTFASSGPALSITGSGSTATWSLPTGTSAVAGAIIPADWSAFNAKESALTFTTNLVRSTNTISVTSTPTFTSSTQTLLTALGTTTLATSGGFVGVGTAAPTQLLHASQSVDGNAISQIENQNSGVSASAVLRALANGADFRQAAHGSGRTATRFGVAIGGYNEVLGVGGNGMLIGTFTANQPVILGTNSTMALTVDAGQRVGIATSTPQSTFHSVGSSTFDGNVNIRATTTINTDLSGRAFQLGGATNPYVMYQEQGTNRLLFGTSTGLAAGSVQAMIQFLPVASTTANGVPVGIYARPTVITPNSTMSGIGWQPRMQIQASVTNVLGVTGLASVGHVPGATTNYNVTDFYSNYYRADTATGYDGTITREHVFYVAGTVNAASTTVTTVRGITVADLNQGTNRYAIITEGDDNIGFGTQAPTARLHVVSSTDSDVLILQDTASCAHNPGTVTEVVTCSSDKKLKKNIRDTILSGIEYIKGFVIKDYHFIPDKKDVQGGVVAQDVQKTHPEMVHTMDAEGTLGVEQPNPWLLIKAIQEQQTQIEDLKGRVDRLEQGLPPLDPGPLGSATLPVTAGASGVAGAIAVALLNKRNAPKK